MLTEYNGDPVAGGTFPALIWKSFMLKALKDLPDATPQQFASPPSYYSSPAYVVMRDGHAQLDNGVCRNVFHVYVFSDGGPQQRANCRANEVQVPNLIGSRKSNAIARLQAQPLTPLLVYKPAKPRQVPGIVVDQIPGPARRLSANDRVTVVLAKPLHGVVPSVVGLRLERALPKLDKLNLATTVRPENADSKLRVLRQWPRAGVAAAPGMQVRLAVRAG